MQQSNLSPTGLVSEPLSGLTSFSKSPEPESRDVEAHIWKQLHLSDHPDSRWLENEFSLASSLQELEGAFGKNDLVVDSPDWIFSCGTQLVKGDVLMITRESRLIATVQAQFNQFKLVCYRPLSARLIKALFELALDRKDSFSVDDSFRRWANVVKWRLGLGSLGYDFSFETVTGCSASSIEMDGEIKKQFSGGPLPGSRSAKQIQILYKYG